MQLLFSSCEAGRVCCWELATGRLLRSLERDDGVGLLVSGSGRKPAL